MIFILAKSKKAEIGLGETVALAFSKKLQNIHCMLDFDNFFNSPTLVEKLFNRGIYCLGTVQSDWKNMAIMKKDKDKGNDIDF